MKKSALYFRHDFNARSDAKMQAVLAELGCAGIGAFWCIVEQLYENDGQLPMSLCNCIAIGLRMSSDAIQRLITEFGLFENDGKMFWSNAVLARIGEHNDFVEQRRQNALKRWHSTTSDKPATDATEMQVNAIASDCNANNNKRNKNNKNTSSSPKGDVGKRSTFAPPTVEEVIAYLNEKGIVNVDAERFVSFYESKGWMIGKNKMKSWKAAIATWSKSQSERASVSTPRRTSSSESTKSANDPWT